MGSVVLRNSRYSPDVTTLPTLGKAALVVSECQRGILDPDISMLSGLAEQASARHIVIHIARLARAFREVQRPVVYCTIAHRPDLAGVLANSLLGAMTRKHPRMLAGTADVEVPEPIEPQNGDFVSCRTTGITAFYGTDLDAILRLQMIDTLVVCGVSTNIALPGLAFEAVNRGYQVLLAEDATAGVSADTHVFMVEHVLRAVSSVTSSGALLDQLANGCGA